MSEPSNLVTIRPGVTFQADAASSFQRVEKRAGRRVDVNSTYRDWDEQMKLYLAYQRDPKNNPLALHPDLSMHCRGLALDTDDHTLMRSMGDYGWRGTVTSEPWHFDYFRSLDKYYGQPAGGDSKPLAPINETEYPDMFIANVKNGNFWMCVTGKPAFLLGAGSDARASGIPIINFPDTWAVTQLQKAWPQVTQ
jgi:hypothetical protein